MALDRKAAVSKIQRDRRIEASRKKRFADLIDTPFSLGTVGINNPAPNALSLPEAGVLGVSFSTGISQGQLILTTSTGRTMGTPDLAADEIWRIGFYEKGVEISAESSLAGTATLHYLDDRRAPFAIATGIFT